jgi:hypothetical protein
MPNGSPVAELRHLRTAALRDAAASINADPSAAREVLAELRPLLNQHAARTINHTGRRPMAARLLVARDLRRTVFVTVGHRYAMALARLALDALARPSALSAAAGRADTVFAGGRGRTFSGHDANVCARLRTVFGLGRQRMYEEIPPADAGELRSVTHMLSMEVRACAAATHREEFGSAWQDSAEQMEPYATGDRRRPYRSRTLAFLSARLDPALDVALDNSEVGQAEHLAIAMAELERAFDSAGCPVAERFGAALTHVTELGAIAALRDEVAERLLFVAERPPLFAAVRDPAGGQWTVRATRPPLAGSTVLRRPGRCPAVDVLPPLSVEHRDRVSTLVDRLAEFTGGRTALPHATRIGVSAADLCAVLTLAVGYRNFR